MRADVREPRPKRGGVHVVVCAGERQRDRGVCGVQRAQPGAHRHVGLNGDVHAGRVAGEHLTLHERVHQAPPASREAVGGFLVETQLRRKFLA